MRRERINDGSCFPAFFNNFVMRIPCYHSDLSRSVLFGTSKIKTVETDLYASNAKRICYVAVYLKTSIRTSVAMTTIYDFTYQQHEDDHQRRYVHFYVRHCRHSKITSKIITNKSNKGEAYDSAISV